MHQLLSIAGIQARIHWAGVDPLCKAVAVGKPDGMGSRKGNHVELAKVVFCKHAGELIKVECWFWQVSFDSRCLRDEAIAAPQFDVECRPPSLELLTV